MDSSDPCQELQQRIQSLPTSQKLEAQRNLELLRSQLKAKIEKEMNIDLTHLALVNLCINPFIRGSGIDSGYTFVRTDPLLSIQSKNFDLMIHNPDSRVTILVECKSSISDPSKEVRETADKAALAEQHKSLLQRIVGDIVVMEFVLCVMSVDAERVKRAIRQHGAALCLWSADLYNNAISLSPTDEDQTKPPWLRGMHRDSRLTGLLLHGVKPMVGGVRVVRFLATSHGGTIVTEVYTGIWEELKRTGSSQFSKGDIRTLVERVLLNHTEEEIEKVVSVGLDIGMRTKILRDETPLESDLSKKKFSLTVRRSIGEEIRNKYIEETARAAACEQIISQLDEQANLGLRRYL